MNLNGRRYGHIRVERMLGQGGMGDVYEGFDEKLTRRVALKVLHHDTRLDAEARTRLNREARSLSQLDHPNICRIYDFIEDGETDVLVLELIDGRTLQQAMNDGLTRTEKLRIARDIASVLVAAHRAGIIHRDLKPENVMLTKSGVVKVLDFGLARWLERERKSDRSYRAISPSALAARLHVAGDDDEQTWGAPTAVHATPPANLVDSSATQAGVTVGTPLFMSPEQARGEALTTASDLYSFGLVMQVLFTERDPYPPNLTAHEVMVRAARGESLPPAGVTRDIAALIKALKALAPSDRLTAADTLQRLQRILETPKRIAWQAALAAVAVLFVLGVWKYTVDLRRERTAAQAAEAEAKRRRAEADSLIGFMLGDLRTKLEPVGRLDILDSVAERSLAYMSSLDPKTLTAAELARNAKALSQLGDVRMTQGNLTAAITAFTQALKLAETASARDPKNPELALGVGTAHFYVGNALRLKNDLAGALLHMREYRRVAEDLSARYPSSDEYQIERGYGHSTVGTILEAQGELNAALQEYELTLDVKNARLAKAPSDTKRQGDVALTLNKIGFAMERLGRLTEARDYYAREFAMEDALTRADPKNTLWRDRLATNEDHIAGIYMAMGDSPSALPHRQAAVDVYRALVSHDPANANWRRNLIITLQGYANELRLAGASDRALETIAEADRLEAELLARDPSREQWRADFALVQTTYARILLALHRAEAASSKAASAVDMYAKVRRTGANQWRIADASLVAGDVASAAGRATAAQSWQSALSLIEPAARATSDPKVIAIAAQALLRLGRFAEAQPFIDRAHAVGYRQGDFERLVQLPR